MPPAIGTAMMSSWSSPRPKAASAGEPDTEMATAATHSTAPSSASHGVAFAAGDARVPTGARRAPDAGRNAFRRSMVAKGPFSRGGGPKPGGFDPTATHGQKQETWH